MQVFIRGFSLFTLLLVFSMILPWWLALAAGLAGTSIAVFGTAGLTLTFLWFKAKGRTRLLVTTVAILCAGAAITPPLSYLRIAERTGAQLSFDPITYLTFSGKTDLPPSDTLTYKQAGDSRLEIVFYRSHVQKQAPVVVLIHGGGWRYGHHLETGLWPRTLTKAGFAVMSIQYRLADDRSPTWRDAPQDVADAISYVRTNAEELGIDAGRVNLLGQSAGGHLALLEAYRNRSVNSVTALYAPADLKLDYQTSRDKSAELDFIGGPPAQYGARYEQVSPMRYVSDTSPRTLLVQGTHDDLVHRSQALILSEALDRVDVEHEVLLLPLTGHSFENQRGGFATQLTAQQVISFLKS